MSPRFPEEVDVFTIPHSRMKHLVDMYLNRFSKTDFTDGAAMSGFLSFLLETFKEFQLHEQIENRFIMDRLKRRLSAMSVYNSAVCNCHQDNRLTEMIETLVEALSGQQEDELERVAFRRRLRDKLDEFTDNFLPHMEEEEQIFQPLLMQYFGYDELRELKLRVLQNHRLSAEKADPEKDPLPPERVACPVPQLPPELLTLIFQHLAPRERALCARVCRTWRTATLAPTLWSSLTLPATGQGVDVVDDMMAQTALKRCDVDADVDESWDDCDERHGAAPDSLSHLAVTQRVCLKSLTSHTLPLVGGYVRRLELAGCRGLTSSHLRQLLIHCVNVRHLDVSYTNIGDCAFKRLPVSALQRLEHCDLSGCDRLTDQALQRLAAQLDLLWPDAACDIEEAAGPGAAAPPPDSDCYDCESQEECAAPAGPAARRRLRDKNGRLVAPPAAARLRFLSLSGCRRVTSGGVARLAACRAVGSLRHLDVSGCCLVSGAALRALQAAAALLPPDRLWYCDFVLDGPHPEQANGCDNVECPIRHCCRN